jgi:hypothetical protein
LATKICVLKNLTLHAVKVLEQDIIAIIQDHVGRQDTGPVVLGNR